MDKTWTEGDAGSHSIPPLEQSPDANSDRLHERFGLHLGRIGDRLEIKLQQRRQRAMAFPVAAFACASAVAASMLPDQLPSVWLFRLVFAAFTSGLLLVALYLPFNSLEIRISRQAVTRLRLWFGVAIKQQQIDPRQIRALDIDTPSGVSLVAGAAPGYELVARGDFGSMRIVDGISDRVLMEALRQQIIGAAGLSRERIAAG